MDEERTTREVHTTTDNGGDSAVERRTVAERSSIPGSVIAQRIVWYVVGFIVALLALRLLLQLLGANPGNGFVNLVYSLSGVFASPFFGMFSYQPSYGRSFFEIGTLVAMIVYTLIGWAVAKLFTLGSPRRDI